MSDFYTKFKHQTNILHTKISNVKQIKDIDEIRKSIMELSNDTRQMRSALSSYDLNVYQKDIEELNNQLNSVKNKLSKPQLSFGFGSKSKIIDKQQIQPDLSKEIESQEISTKIELKNTDFRTVHSDSPNFTHILDSKIILFKDLVSVQISDIQSSLVVITSVNGSIYISDAKNTVFIVNCHQFRMHNSTNCTIYISCRSKRPIIEKCTDLRFGQFPNQIDPTLQTTDWEAIDDFNWLRKTPNMNWRSIDRPSTEIKLDDSLDILLKCLHNVT